jgi:hypothetical protein
MADNTSRRVASRHPVRWTSNVLVRCVAAAALVIVGIATAVTLQAGASESHAKPSAHKHANAPGFPGTSTNTPFNECPAIGADTSCGLLIVVSNNGDQILGNPANGPYDGADDTLVGILNESSKPLYRIQLSAPSVPIFGFDGDGICVYAKGGAVVGTGTTVTTPTTVTIAPTPVGYTGDSYCSAKQKAGQTANGTVDTLGADYQGPTNTYSTINTGFTRGNVNFSNGLAPGGATYFSLETSLTAGQLGVQYGYWLAAADGGIFAYDAPFQGSMGGKALNKPVVGIAADPNTGGYWEVASDGGLFAFNAPFYGSTGGIPINAPVVGMVATPDGLGYWEVASDGGIFAFGDAAFYGSMGGQHLNAPIVGIASTPDGKGYYEVASDGGIFAFGDATFKGSMGGQHLNKPVVGIAGDQGTGGYWEVASDGGLFAFGTAPFYGSTGGMTLNKPVVGMAATPDGKGYWEVASDGGIFNYGDAFFWGSTGSMTLNSPVVGIAASA